MIAASRALGRVECAVNRREQHRRKLEEDGTGGWDGCRRASRTGEWDE